jgi:uncharacterized damage-inducible protein DinB
MVAMEIRAMMSSVIKQLNETHAGDPWYGTSRTRLLSGLTAGDAAAHPVPSGHSIWELVLHMTAWTREATRRLGGAQPAIPVEGDWPAVPVVSDEAWKKAQADLTQAHAELVGAAQKQSSNDLVRREREERDPALGTGVDRAGLIAGVAQHDAYHIGQIAVVRQALGKPRPANG